MEKIADSSTRALPERASGERLPAPRNKGRAKV